MKHRIIHASLAVSAITALFLAVFHIADLNTANRIYASPDPIFPVVNGIWLYLLVIVLLLSHAILCTLAIMKDSGILSYAALTSFTIPASILLYRFGLSFVGISECNCLGRMAAVLNISKQNEAPLRYALLALLCLPALTYILTRPKAIAPAKDTSRAVLTSLMLLLILQFNATSIAEDTITYHGDFESKWQNPHNGTIYSNQCSRGHFVARISGDNFEYALTNDLDNTVNRTICDGTSITFIQSETRFNIADKDIRPGQQIATVDWGKYPIMPLYSVRLPNSLIWAMFCLPPQSEFEKPGNQLPLPWSDPRYNLRAYGYSWKATPITSDGSVGSLEIHRDESADLQSPEAEFRRAILTYPYNAAFRQSYFNALQNRKFIPSGLLAAKLRTICTNSATIPIHPIESELLVYFHDYGVRNGTNYAHPCLQMKAKVRSVTRSSNPIDTRIHSDSEGSIAVFDFRYKTNMNGRYCERIAYQLESGSPVRAFNDTRNLTLQADTLLNAPYVETGYIGKKHKYLWGGFATILVVGVLATRPKAKQ